MIVKFILCFFTSIALNIRSEIPEELSQMTGESSLSKIFSNFQNSLSGTMAAATLLFAALVAVEIYLHKKQAKGLSFYTSSASSWPSSGPWVKASGAQILFHYYMPTPAR